MPLNPAKLTESLRMCRSAGVEGNQQVDADLLRSLTQQLTGFPIFFSDGELRNVGRVVASVVRLRGCLCSVARDLPLESELEAMIVALSYAVKQFLAITELIESEIREYLQQIDTRIVCRQSVDAAALGELAKWKQLGYPDRVIWDNLDLDLGQLPMAAQRSLFVLATGALRAQFGMILAAVGGLLGSSANAGLEKAPAITTLERSAPYLPA